MTSPRVVTRARVLDPRPKMLAVLGASLMFLVAATGLVRAEGDVIKRPRILLFWRSDLSSGF